MARAWFIVALWLSGAAQAQPLERFAFKRPQLGTDIQIILYAPNAVQANRAASAAFARIDTLEARLSDWRSDSELSQLPTGSATRVSQELWDVLEAAQHIAEASNGAFDVTIGPLSRLWRWSMRRGFFPDQEKLISTRSKVGYRYLVLNPAHQTVRLTKPGMSLDLGGIGKGYAADIALGLLETLGYPYALVDAGGDMAIGAAPPGTVGWGISVESVGPGGLRTKEEVFLADCGIASSGATYRYLEHEGVRYSHIVDPGTGIGVTHERIVTVIAPTGMLADAWASAYSVMEFQQALSHAEAKDLLALRIVQREEEGYVMQEAGGQSFARRYPLY